MLDRADHALFGERALIIIEAGRAAREIDKVLGCTLPRPSATGPTPNPPAGNALVALAPLLGRQAAQEHIERLGTVPTTSLKLMSVQGAAEYAHVKHSDGAPHD